MQYTRNLPAVIKDLDRYAVYRVVLESVVISQHRSIVNDVEAALGREVQPITTIHLMASDC